MGDVECAGTVCRYQGEGNGDGSGGTRWGVWRSVLLAKNIHFESKGSPPSIIAVVLLAFPRVFSMFGSRATMQSPR